MTGQTSTSSLAQLTKVKLSVVAGASSTQSESPDLDSGGSDEHLASGAANHNRVARHGAEAGVVPDSPGGTRAHLLTPSGLARELR